MSTLFQTQMPPVVLEETETDVDINWERDYWDAESITIQAPNYAETLSFQGSLDGSTFVTLKDAAGNTIAPPAANNIEIINGIVQGLKTLRIHSTTPAAAQRTFLITKNWRAC